MPRDTAVELMDFNPFLDPLPEGFSGPQENRRVKERFEQYVSIGFYRDLDAPDGSQMRYYLYEDRHKPAEDIKTYTSLVDLERALQTDAYRRDIFRNNPKLFIMGHGGDNRYGVGGDHPKRLEYEHYLEDSRIPTDPSEQIHGANFDKIINGLREVVTHEPGELSVTLEVCNSDNLFLGKSLWGHKKTFLASLSETHKDITFSGTGPWDTSHSWAAVTTGNRAGADALHTPITSMGGNVWKHGNTVIFYNAFNIGEDTTHYQVVVKKSKFSSTETAKALKINTVNYAATILETAPLSLSAKKEMLQQISENPKILKIDDLKIIDDFPSEEFRTDSAMALAQTENDILAKEKDDYIRLVQTILGKGDAVDDRDLLELALGLKDYAEKGSIEGSIFEGHQELLDAVFENRRLLELVMVTSGKVLIATPSNDSLIDLLQSKGIGVNSVDEHGMTALHYAVQNFYVYRDEPLHLVKKLLDCGANVDLADKAGYTPISLAMEHGSKGMVMGGQQLIKLTTRPTRAKIEERMSKGEVPGVSIAYLDAKKSISIEPVVIGTTDVHSSTPHIPVEQDTVFGAASLSKPVFSYLALKLIADKKLSTTDGKPFELDTPISEILPIDEFYGKEVSSDFSVEAKKITPRMVLSHTTGIPINGAPRVDFEPGTQYAYGNTALYYLQKAIEKQTGQSLETLAQEEVFRPLGMTHSSFLPPVKEGSTPQPIAANSLHTTASDYARFAAAWMQEKNCSLIQMPVVPTPENQKDATSSRYILTETGFFYYNKSKGSVQEIELDEAGSKLAELHRQFSDVTEDRPIERLSDKALSEITIITGHTNPLQEAFRPAIPLTEDQWAIDMGVAEKDRQHLAWGLGLGLQLDDTGEVTTAFHSGDMNQWRGWVAMDVKEKSAVVYFANGDDAKNGSGHGYGHVLADVIVAPEVELTHGLDWFFQKFGVSRDVEPGWKAKEEADTARIDTYVRSRLSSPTGETKGPASLEVDSGLPEWQSQLIDKLFNAIKNNYIFSEKIDETAFKQRLSEDFSRINLEFPSADKETFCDEANKILKHIDPHLKLQYDPAQIAEHKAHGRVVPDERENGCARFVLDGLDAPASWYEHFERENYGFQDKTAVESSSIPDTIGYMKITDFLSPKEGRLGELAEERAHKMLESMQGKEAVVIDLRDSHGGSPDMIEFIMSYLLTNDDKSKIAGGVYNMIDDSSTGLTTAYQLRPTAFSLDMPIYVLTNDKTFSAAEELAYDLQQINAHALRDGRFTVIGQTTQGGAHPMGSFPLMDLSGGVDDDYFLWVPTKTARNPYTGTNWEDGPKADGNKPGVRPNITIEADQDALEMALKIESIRPKPTPIETVESGTTLQFKDKLRGIMPTTPIPAASMGEGDKVDDKSSITPFQTKPKPPGTV